MVQLHTRQKVDVRMILSITLRNENEPLKYEAGRREQVTNKTTVIVKNFGQPLIVINKVK